MSSINDILNFWFGESFEYGMPAENRNALWFGFNPKTDLQIKERFTEDVIKASSGHYDNWRDQAEGRMALITLLDQLPRNIYRGTKKAFAFDDKALQLCLEGLALGHDQQLIPAYRSFFYLPLEHSEHLNHQQRCVALFEAFLEESVPENEAAIRSSLDFARLHYDIIKRFERFPHRNTLLGRQSTPEELAYLQQSRANFGQGS